MPATIHLAPVALSNSIQIGVMTLVSDARKRSGLSQAAFAAKAGTSRTRLSAYENGRTSPELDTLERIPLAATGELVPVPEGSARARIPFDRAHDAVRVGDATWALRLVAELIAWVRSGVVNVQ